MRKEENLNMKTYLLSLSQMLKDNPLVEDIPLWIGGLLLIYGVQKLFDIHYYRKNIRNKNDETEEETKTRKKMKR